MVYLSVSSDLYDSLIFSCDTYPVKRDIIIDSGNLWVQLWRQLLNDFSVYRLLSFVRSDKCFSSPLGETHSTWSLLLPWGLLIHSTDKYRMKWPPGFSALGDLFLNGCVCPVWESQPPVLLAFVLMSPHDILICVLECVIIGSGSDTYHPTRRARALSSDMVAHTPFWQGHLCSQCGPCLPGGQRSSQLRDLSETKDTIIYPGTGSSESQTWCHPEPWNIQPCLLQ